MLVILAVVASAAGLFTDNYISDYYFRGSGAAAQKMFFTFAQPVAGILFLVLFGVDFGAVRASEILLFLGSGLLSSLAGIFYYKALEADDSTNMGIFVQLTPVLYLLLGWAFLGETISLMQMAAFLIVGAAPLIVILTTRKRSRKVKFRAMCYAFLYVLIGVVGNLIFVRGNASALEFGAEMGLMFIGKGLGNGVIMLMFPKWRRRFWRVMRESRRKVLRPLTASFLLGLLKEFSYRGALVLAPSVALASVASDSAQPVVVFFMGLVLTIIWPKFGREKLRRKDVLVHLIATGLVVVGVVMMRG